MPLVAKEEIFRLETLLRQTREDDIDRMTRDYLKNRILVQGQGGRKVPTGGILKYFEDWNRAPNAEIGQKDIFEIASKTAMPSLNKGEFL
jgi:hypothetical protein